MKLLTEVSVVIGGNQLWTNCIFCGDPILNPDVISKLNKTKGGKKTITKSLPNNFDHSMKGKKIEINQGGHCIQAVACPECCQDNTTISSSVSIVQKL